MKKIFICLLLLASVASAQTFDDDGLLNAAWSPPLPTYGDTLSHYQAELIVNSAAVWADDSIPAPDTVLVDFYQLASEGDWAVLKVRSVATPGNPSISSWAETDTCYFDTGSPINPPTGLHWIVSGLLSPRIRETDRR